MDLVFELSGEHPELARAEVRALMEAHEKKYRIKNDFKHLFILDTQKMSKEEIREIFNRLGFVHGVYCCLVITKDIKELLDTTKYLGVEETYRVRAKRIKNSLKKHRLEGLEKKIGSKIEGDVDLESPKKCFKLFLTEDNFVLTEKILNIDRSSLRNRKPHKRNFFKPGAIEPSLARSIINLTRTKNGELLDIFTGTGSFLIEATEMNISSIGLDADPEILLNAKKNLKKFNNEKTPELVLGDAKKLPFETKSLDAAVADPPYGKSSVTYGDPEKTYVESIKEAMKALKPGSYLCFISPKERVDYNMELNEIERYEVREHKSLTRVIRLFRRKK